MTAYSSDYPFQVYLNRYSVKKGFFRTIVSNEIASHSLIAHFKELKDARLFAKMKTKQLKSKVIRAVVFVPDLSNPFGELIPDIERF